MPEQITLTQLIDELEANGTNRDLSLEEVLNVIGERGFGPIVLILALVAILPTGVIPGVPTVCGLCIALLAGQLAAGKRRPWLPKRLRNLSIDRARYQQAAKRIRPWSRRIDRLVKPRLSALTDEPVVRGVGVVMVLIALCMPPLELIPFAAAGPGAALVLTGLGLTGRDGVWVLLGLIPAGVAVVLVVNLALAVF